MRLIRAPKARRRYSFGVLLVALALAVLALAGAATKGQAAASPGVVTTVAVLNDTGDLQAGPSPGGNIGYTLRVENKSTSTANHFAFTDSIDPAGILFFADPDLSNAPGLTCSGTDGTTTTTFSCQSTKLDPGQSFTVTLLFHTSNTVPGSTIKNNAVVSFDSQTNGPANHKTIPTVTTRTVADVGTAESLALHGDKLTAGGNGQTSDLTMPDSFVSSFSLLYVKTAVQNVATNTAPCVGCALFQTLITIPPASTFVTNGPFWDGTNAKPFRWTLTLPGSLLPKGFKLHGVYHNGSLLPMCAFDASVPPQALPSTVDPGICVATLVQTPNTKTITATGLALTNGSYGFG
jgi:uncharacterized repeat protein (TIGR01451 family)